MKSKFVQVTSWASFGTSPRPHQRSLGDVGFAQCMQLHPYWFMGPKVFLVNRFPFIKLEWSYVPFKNHCTASIRRDRIVLPSGFGPDGFIKALFGQRVLK